MGNADSPPSTCCESFHDPRNFSRLRREVQPGVIVVRPSGSQRSILLTNPRKSLLSSPWRNGVRFEKLNSSEGIRPGNLNSPSSRVSPRQRYRSREIIPLLEKSSEQMPLSARSSNCSGGRQAAVSFVLCVLLENTCCSQSPVHRKEYHLQEAPIALQK